MSTVTLHFDPIYMFRTRLRELQFLQACIIFHLFVLHDPLIHRLQVAGCSPHLSELMTPDIPSEKKVPIIQGGWEINFLG